MNLLRALLYAACILIAMGCMAHAQRGHAEPRLHPDNDDYNEDYSNETAVPEAGSYVGSPCSESCSSKLLHVRCNAATSRCECEPKYPVLVKPERGCTEVKKLGEQCFYLASCEHYDEHSSCVQVNHNAICQCDLGYHSVSYQRPTKRIFCTEDMSVLTADVPTLLGVSTGIAVLAGLICFVLHLFSRARYPRPRHYADANDPPPILFSGNETAYPTGIPLSMAVHGRSSSRASQRSAISLTSGYSRRPSSAPPGSRGVLVSASRAGSRRPSLASLHSGSSVKSYSRSRYERELEQKEARQEMKKHLARIQAANNFNNHNNNNHNLSRRREGHSPSARSPNSTDELLPTITDDSSDFSLPTSTFVVNRSSNEYQGEIGPCSSTEPY